MSVNFDNDYFSQLLKQVAEIIKQLEQHKLLIHEFKGFKHVESDTKEETLSTLSFTYGQDDIERLKENESKKQEEVKSVEFEAKGEDLPTINIDGSIRLFKPNLYQYRYRVNGELKTVYGKTPELCYQKRLDKESNKKKNNESLKLSDWLDTCYQNIESNLGESEKTSVQRFIRYMNEGIKEKHLKKITFQHLQEFVNTFSKSKNTQNKIITRLKQFFGIAFESGKIKTNPAKLLKKASYSKQSYNVIQPHEQQLIFASIDDIRYMRLFWFCCCTGMRISEAVSIKTKNVDKLNGDIVIDLKDTNTKKHQRRIPFLPYLIDIPRHEMLFPDITARQAQDYFYRLFKALNLDIVVHSTRHTFASCCYHVGFKDKDTQSFLGHSQISVTLDTYTHIIKNQTSLVIEYLRRLKEDYYKR